MNVDPPSPNTDIIEGLHAHAVMGVQRGSLKSTKKARPLRPVFTTGPDGEVTGIVDHGDVVRGLFKRQGITDVVVEGKRPERVKCTECPALVKVPTTGGQLPKRCKACSRAAAVARNRKRRAKNPQAERDAQREQSRKWRAAAPEKAAASMERRRARHASNPEKERERARKRRASNPEKEREQARKRRPSNRERKRDQDRRSRARKRAQREAKLPKQRLTQDNILAVTGIPARTYLQTIRAPGFPVPVAKLGKLRIVDQVAFLAWLRLQV